MRIDAALMFTALTTAYVTHWASLWAQRNGYRFEMVLWYAIEWMCVVLSVAMIARIFEVWSAHL